MFSSVGSMDDDDAVPGRVFRPFVVTPGLAAIGDRRRDLEAVTAEAAGVLNVAHGRLVQVAAQILADHRGLLGPGVHTPAAWLAWHGGLSPSKAADVEHLARRAGELPDTVAALVAGELSLDQASVIARNVPADYEASACEVAKLCTVGQLRRTLPNYGYDSDTKPDTDPAENQRRERLLSTGVDARGWWGRIRMPVEEGAVFEAACNTKRDQLHRARGAEQGDDAVSVDGVDALLAMAESAMADMEARLPGTERIVVNLHLDANPNDITDGADAGVLWLHQHGGINPASRRFLTCDAQLRSLLYRDGVPINAGRTTRNINRHLRRSIEHRDRGCATPGCGKTRGLEIHHIRHWEDGGPTDTANLLALCRRHHRDHHHRLDITGNPDLPAGTPGALASTDAHGRPMTPGPNPITPATDATPGQAAQTIGLAPPRYQHPLNERLDHRDFHLQRAHTTTHRPHPGADTSLVGTDETEPAAPATTDPTHCTNPTRARPTDT